MALEVRAGRAPAMEFAQALTKRFRGRGAEIAAPGDTEIDLVVAVGGDGTMLAAVQKALAADVPVVGFNLGTLGFLAAAEPQDVAEVVDRLVSGGYEIDERMTVQADFGDRVALGVNDVVVEKVDSMRLVSLDVTVDQLPFVTYRADGLVVATPTGSTAYSFSAGGPLVDSNLEALVVTPVASHSLFDRAIVLPPESEIGVTVSADRVVRVNVDKTDLGHLFAGDTVTIRRGDRDARFVSFGARPFPGLIKDKFGLG